LAELPSDLLPENLDEAYRIQEAVTALRALPLAGFKVGLTNQAAQRATGALEPIVGQLCAPDVRRPDARIELPAGHLRILEPEVIFEIGNDLPPQRAPFNEQHIAASVRRAFAGIELCNARFEDRGPFLLTRLVADNSNSDLIIVGDPLEAWDAAALADLPVTLQVGNKAPVRGTTANVLGQPLRSLTWLANWLARRGEGLKSGQLIASGSCAGMTQFGADDVVVATFGERTRVRVEFTSGANKQEVRA
jgi:2-keto-4-pentenoate hydratase